MKQLAVIVLVSAAVTSVASVTSAPPPAPVRPVTDDYFGTKVVDNYRYMEDLKDPEVQAWIRAQSQYTRSVLDTLPGRDALLRRIAELDASQPATVEGLRISQGRYYTLQTPTGAQSARLAVRTSPRGLDRVLVDPERLRGAPDSHVTIHGFRPSPDGRYVAYLTAVGGSEQSTLRILDVAAGKDLPETADRVGNAPFWRDDNRSFFYTRRQLLTPGMPESERDKDARVYLHVVGADFADDAPVLGRGVRGQPFPISDAEFPFIVTAPGSRFAIAFVSPGVQTQIRVYAARIDTIGQATANWRPIAPSYEDEYIASDDPDRASIALAGDTLFWLSRRNSPQGRIMRLDLSQPGSSPQIAVPEGPSPIAAVYASRDALYWRVTDAGVRLAYRLALRDGAHPEALRLPYPADVTDIVTDPSSGAATLDVSSWLRSPTYLEAAAGSRTVVDDGLRPAGRFDRPGDLVAEEVKVHAPDGTPVPLTIIYRKGVKRDGANLAVLIGYGAYGLSMAPYFEPRFLAWYERGGVIAIAHVRGGGEYGESWHEAGRLQSKPNTWRDYIACAQFLVDRRYTRPRRLSALGGSAGGILIGRAIEERPDLFAAALVSVPLADMLRFETTANGPGNTPEFGSVATEAGFRALHAMSPYAHVTDGERYPAVLISTGINDQRVAAWLPAKFAARLQAATGSGRPVLLRVDYDAGHGGIDATRDQQEQEMADEMSFALWQSGDRAFEPRP